eukprot:TRINITY_DN28635_c0_g1_i2.p1 TRINITY_DN28635_c0_g1~~TRINITY_DN28635_c0_g1_i2.p1  ORF type:complete len:272 (-),score=87.32 TRINITY_DN28635_c0_g1_i2:48-863(-)
MADRLEKEHDFLDEAKSFNWDSVKSMVEESPHLVNVQPAGRWTALHQAAFNGSGAMVGFLLEKGADPQAATRDGKTPLEVAKGDARKRLEEVAKKASGDDAAPEEPPKKKAKIGEGYSLNINSAVDKAFEHSSLAEIADAPTSALQGIAERGREILKKFKVHTVRDLGTWKFYRIAKAINGLAALEQAGKRSEGAALNLNKALDKKHEKKSLSDITKLPPSALQGLAPWADEELAKINVKTIAALGDWKFAKWSEWIAELAGHENLDFSSL